MFHADRFIKAIGFSFLFLFSTQLVAKDSENKTKISENVRRFAEAMDLQTQVEASVKGYLNQFGEMTGISRPNARRLADKLAWKHLEEDFLRIFAETFTDAELEQLIAFMNSPVGKKYIKNVPVIQEKSLQIVKRRFDQAIQDLNL